MSITRMLLYSCIGMSMWQLLLEFKAWTVKTALRTVILKTGRTVEMNQVCLSLCYLFLAVHTRLCGPIRTLSAVSCVVAIFDNHAWPRTCAWSPTWMKEIKYGMPYCLIVQFPRLVRITSSAETSCTHTHTHNNSKCVFYAYSNEPITWVLDNRHIRYWSASPSRPRTNQ